MDEDQDRADRLRRGCTRFLLGHGDPSPAEKLGEISQDVIMDRYGDGGVVAELEAEVAELLDMPAAVFLPSGTMAQQIALRIHADDRGRQTVAFHPACHVDVHEGRAYERLHGLVGRPVGSPHQVLSLADLEEVAEPLAALVLELPQRDLGGQLPTWEELVGQTSWAHEQGAAAHLDGARLWQCGPAYERALADIAAPFDTVYVSFYKDLGALGGCCLLGQPDVIAQAREWRHRHGGTLFGLWPFAASALQGLRTRLPRMAAYHGHAQDIAAALRGLGGVRMVPDPPQTSMLHLHLQTSAEHLEAAVLGIAEDEQVWTWRDSAPTGDPAWRLVELRVGEATLGFAPGEVRSVIQRLVAS